MKTGNATKMAVAIIFLTLLTISFSTTKSHAYNWTINNKTEFQVMARIGTVVFLFPLLPPFPIPHHTDNQIINPGEEGVFSDGGMCLWKIEMIVSIPESGIRKLKTTLYTMKCWNAVFNLYASYAMGEPIFKLCNEDNSECKDLNFVD